MQLQHPVSLWNINYRKYTSILCHCYDIFQTSLRNKLNFNDTRFGHPIPRYNPCKNKQQPIQKENKNIPIHTTNRNLTDRIFSHDMTHERKEGQRMRPVSRARNLLRTRWPNFEPWPFFISPLFYAGPKRFLCTGKGQIFSSHPTPSSVPRLI